MNKKQWLASADPQMMLAHLKGRASDRKLRLFAVACCRRFWPLVSRDDVSRQVVEVAERFADGIATVKECHLARATAEVLWGPGADRILCAVRELARAAVKSKASGAALDACREAASLAGRVARAAAREANKSDAEADAAERCAIALERRQQVVPLRCIFGNPFKPVAADPNWLTSTVLLLARGSYEEKAFDRMPILADALQDAGCASDDVLNHLRHDADHVRGCWALDLVLGKG